MPDVLSITLQDLLEIDAGRGIVFRIFTYSSPDVICIELKLGEYCCGRAISLIAYNDNGEFKDYMLRELRRYADELYWKYRTSDVKENPHANS